MTDQSLTEKRTADRLRRETQAADAPKAWAAYVADIQRTRDRTALLREERLAREAAAAGGDAPTVGVAKRKSRRS